MESINSFFRYLGYIFWSFVLGWLSNLSGNENDFILKISSNLIPLLITILAFYVTIFGLILKELAHYKEKTGKEVKNVLKSMKRDLTIGFSIICLAFIFYVIRDAVGSFIPLDWFIILTICSNAVTVFSFFYFLLLIYDSVLGLWDLIEENN